MRGETAIAIGPGRLDRCLHAKNSERLSPTASRLRGGLDRGEPDEDEAAELQTTRAAIVPSHRCLRRVMLESVDFDADANFPIL